MALNAFKNGLSVVDEATMNSIFTAQSSSLIFDGDKAAGKNGTGTIENNLSLASYITRFTTDVLASEGLFESDSNGDGIPDGWEFYANPSYQSIATDRAYKGTKSVKVSFDNTGGTSATTVAGRSTLRSALATVYTASMWVYIDPSSVMTNSGVTIYLEFTDDAGNRKGIASAVANKSITGQWQKVTISRMADPGTTKCRVLAPYVNVGAGDKVIVWYAQVVIEPAIGRMELEVVKYGVGADIIIEIRDNAFLANGTNDGNLLKSITFPAKIIPSIKAFISFPIDLSGATSDGQYWLVVKKAGDATNHIRWIGESSQDAAYPVYSRTGASGAWTLGNALHFNVFANSPGGYLLKHSIYGQNAKTLTEYNANGLISWIWRWLPATDGSWMICEKMTPTYNANGVPVTWGVQ
jgi:hypothetical protein